MTQTPLTSKRFLISKPFRLSLAAPLLLLTCNALATHDHNDDDHDHSHHHDHKHAPESGAQAALSAHVHGVATVLWVAEGETIHLTLEAPASDLLGFESVAVTPAQQQRLAEVRRQLADPVFWVWQPEGCRLLAADLDFSSVTADTQTTSDGHADIRAEYRFRCSPVRSGRSLRLGLFDAFADLEKITVQWVLEHRQGQQVLHRGRGTPQVTP